MNTPSPTPALGAAFALAAIGLFALAGCGGESGADDAGPAPYADAARVEALDLEPQVFEDVIELTGTVEALDDATLSAQASGTLEYLADLGTPVEAGQVVARLDDDEAQAAVAQARAQLQTAQSRLALAQSNYQRQQPLYRDSIISAQEFAQVRTERQQAQAAVNQAEAQLASARQRLGNTRLRAPFSGIVEEHFYELGEQVSTGQQVVRVTDITPAKIRAGVPERYASDIERGTQADVRFKAINAKRTGQVTFVSSVVDPESRTFTVEISLPNRGRELKPEMVAQLYMTRAVLDSAIVIPRAAIIRDERGQHVYTLDRLSGNAPADTIVAVARERDITVGPTYAERAVITSGLSAGQELVVAGQSDLAPGDTVVVTQRYERAPAAGTPFEANPATAPPGATPGNLPPKDEPGDRIVE